MLGKWCSKLCKADCDKICPYSWTILRVVVGFIMAAHGWQKVQDVGAFAGNLEQMGFPLPLFNAYLATAGELLGGLGLMLGLITRLAAFGVFATMAVAVFGVHLPNGLFAKDGGFEYPITLLVVALFFMANGAGPYSLDNIVCKKLSCCQKDKPTS